MKASTRAVLCLLALFPQAAPLGAHPLRALKPGDPGPAFSLGDAQGRTHSAAIYKDHPLVLCYFRPGQDLSESALSMLERLQTRYAKSGVVFLAVYHAEPEVPKPVKPRPFPVLSDERREFYASWGLFILPTTIVLDREHRVRAAHGSYEEETEAEIARSLDGILGLREVAKVPARPVAPGGEVPEVGLARRLLADGRAGEALAALGPLLKESTTDCGPRLAAAEALLTLGRPGEAGPQAQRCLEGEPESPRAALLLGRARAASGDLVEGERWLKKAALGPGVPEARYELGMLYERTGRKDEALAEYRAALARLLVR